LLNPKGIALISPGLASLRAALGDASAADSIPKEVSSLLFLSCRKNQIFEKKAGQAGSVLIWIVFVKPYN